jgi:hypothetical protein
VRGSISKARDTSPSTESTEDLVVVHTGLGFGDPERGLQLALEPRERVPGDVRLLDLIVDREPTH